MDVFNYHNKNRVGADKHHVSTRFLVIGWTQIAGTGFDSHMQISIIVV